MGNDILSSCLEMENSNGQMVKNTKVNGKMESNMDLEHLSTKLGRFGMGSGRTVSLLHGEVTLQS